VLSRALRIALAQASAVTAVSRYTLRTLARVTPSTVPLTVLYPGVDVERFSPKVDGSPIRERFDLVDRPVVLCISRLVPRKGQDVLTRGIQLVEELVPGAALLLAGDGPYRPELEALAREAPPGSVMFAGEIREEEAPAYYAACDVFAMPCRSRWGGLEVEGFGIVFLEAAAASKAVIAGRSGGAAEAVADEQTGLLVEGREPKAVALAVASALQDRATAERMGSAGRARVEEEFAWPIVADRLAEILSNAVG
jgi:phosphatidyl-myo-inositol dimannoside synthase